MSSAIPGYCPQFNYGYNLRKATEDKVDQSINLIKQAHPSLVNSCIKELLEAAYAGLRDGIFSKEGFLARIQNAVPQNPNIIRTCSHLFGLNPASKIGYFYSSISHKFDKEGFRSSVLPTLISYYMDEQRPEKVPSELQALLTEHQEEENRGFESLHVDAAQEFTLRHAASPLDDYISTFMEDKDEYQLLCVPMRKLLRSVSKLMQTSEDPQRIKDQFLLKFKAALTSDRCERDVHLTGGAEREHTRWIEICDELAGFDLNATVFGWYFDSHHQRWFKTEKPDTAFNAFEQILGYRLYPWHCYGDMPQQFSKILKQHQEYSVRLANPAAWAAANGRPPLPGPAAAAAESSGAAAAGPAPDDLDWRASAGGSMSSPSATRPASSAAAAGPSEDAAEGDEFDISHLLGATDTAEQPPATEDFYAKYHSATGRLDFSALFGPADMSGPADGGSERDSSAPTAVATARHESESLLRARGASSSSAAAAGPSPIPSAAPAAAANAPAPQAPQPPANRPKGFFQQVWDTSAFFFGALKDFFSSIWRAVTPWRS